MRGSLRDAFEARDWSGRKVPSRSGAGSTLAATGAVRAALPGIFDRYSVRRFLDAPCGDWFWMRETDLAGFEYIGGDISLEVIDGVRAAYQAPGRSFVHLDITSDPLPAVDMVMCRDCLFHLKWWLRWRFFRNFVESGIPWLLTTMHHTPVNRRLRKNGGFAPFNPWVDPLTPPAPVESFSETGTLDLSPGALATAAGRLQRSMGIWSRAQVIEALERRADKEPAT